MFLTDFYTLITNYISMPNGRLKSILMATTLLLLMAVTLSAGCIGGSEKVVTKAVFDMTEPIHQPKIVAITAEMWHNDSIRVINHGGMDARQVDSLDIQINGFSCTGKTWQPVNEDQYDSSNIQQTQKYPPGTFTVLNEDDCDAGLSISSNQPNRIVVTGHFTDGISQVLLEEYLKVVE